MPKYPMYLISDDHLVRIGPTRDKRGEYRRRIHRSDIEAIAQRLQLLRSRDNGSPHVRPADILPIIGHSGRPMSMSQVYDAMGWMRHNGIIEKCGQLGYIVGDDIVYKCRIRLSAVKPLVIRPAVDEAAPSDPQGPTGLLRRVRRQSRLIKELRQSIEALTDLVLESFSKPETPESSPACVIPAAKRSRVAIAGVRRHQRQMISRRLAAISAVVTAEFVDAELRKPESLSDFDAVYCVQCTPSAWKRRAKHVLNSRFHEHRGTSTIVEAIERLAGSPV